MPLATRRLHKRAILLPQLLAIGILLAPDGASADQLCGRQFDSLSQLYAGLRGEAEASHGWRVIVRSTHVTFVATLGTHLLGQMIWTFAPTSQPALPTCACLPMVA